MVPVNVAFHSKTIDNTILLTIDAYVDLVFFVDLILNFRTTYVGKSREIIVESTAIRTYYLKSWFLIDLLSCLPYDALFSFNDQAKSHSSILNGLKVLRLLRIGRVVRKLDQYLEAGGAVLLLLVLCFLLVSHWLACIWYSIGIKDIANGIHYGWISELHNRSLSNLHLSRTNDSEHSKVESYITALYFVMTCTTAVGFGNVAANTELEKLFSLFSMAIGAMMFATIFGNITTIFQQMFSATARYHDMINHIRSFVDLHNIPADLGDKILDYVISRWSITKGVDQDKVLLYCPPNMKGDICVHLNRDIFSSNPAFRVASEVCLRALAVHVIIEHHAPGDTVMRQGDIIDSLFFVVSGTLEVTQEDEITALLVKGDVFGNCFWEHRTFKQSTCTVKTLSYATVHAIKCRKFLEILDLYPTFAKSFSLNMTITCDLNKRWKLQKTTEPTIIVEVPSIQSAIPITNIVARIRRFSQETLIGFPLLQRRNSDKSLNRLSQCSDSSRPNNLPLPRVTEEIDNSKPKRPNDLMSACGERCDLTPPPQASQDPTPTAPIRGVCDKCGSDLRRLYEMQTQIQQVISALHAQVDELSTCTQRDFAALDARVGLNEREIDLLFEVMRGPTSQPGKSETEAEAKDNSALQQAPFKPCSSQYPQVAIVKMESIESATSSLETSFGSS